MPKQATKRPIPKPLFDTLQYTALNQSIPDYIDTTYLKDYQYAIQFLYSYRGSNATYNSYRREIERLLQWAWLIEQKTLKDLKRAHIEAFIEFCQAPPLSWIATKKSPRFLISQGQRVPNKAWRPFVATVSKTDHLAAIQPNPKNYQMAQTSLHTLFAILGSFFSYLLQEDYIAVNPVAQLRQKSKFIRKYQHKSIIRRLSIRQWSYVIHTAEQMAHEDPKQHERTLFIMNALYGMYLRISELAASDRWIPQMADFRVDIDGNWWFVTVGKGNKERQITVSNDMLNALKRYRTSLGLSALPSAGENTPLIKKNIGKGPISSTRQIRQIVQNCFDKAIHRLKTDGFSDDADQLQAATVHWLRHTGISEDVKFRPREHVRDDAGHSSNVIDKYIDIELKARHASGKHKKIKGTVANG